MKTLEEVLQLIREGEETHGSSVKEIDNRSYRRLADYFEVEQWPLLGIELREGVSVEDAKKKFMVKEWTRENIIEQMKLDVEFGFEKALNQRGISSGLMYETVKLWLWVLNDELELMKAYAQYGLPLFRAVAVKYEFENPIGSDTGTERKYSG